jgi:type VI secretion system protein ImpA
MSASWGEELLAPISADHPCGENLENTHLLSSFDVFRLFGQGTSPDARPDPKDPEGKRVLPPPDWDEIKERTLETLRKSKDIRLLAHFATASLWTDDLPAFSRSLTIASQWLANHWAQTYPLVDDDDIEGIQRRGALNYFADPMAVVNRLRRVPLARSRRHGVFGLRDLDVAAGVQQPRDGEPHPDEARIRAAFAEVPEGELKQLQQSAAEALVALENIGASMVAGAGPEAAPDFSALSKQLQRIDRVLRDQLTARAGITPGSAAGDVAAPADGGGTIAAGPIKSRQDAIRALEAVAEYFRRNEPSSPIPLFVDRAKRLVAKDFLEVLADVAPDALPQARAAGGVQQSE